MCICILTQARPLKTVSRLGKIFVHRYTNIHKSHTYIDRLAMEDGLQTVWKFVHAGIQTHTCMHIHVHTYTGSPHKTVRIKNMRIKLRLRLWKYSYTRIHTYIYRLAAEDGSDQKDADETQAQTMEIFIQTYSYYGDIHTHVFIHTYVYRLATDDGSDQEDADETQTMELGLGKLSLFAGKESVVYDR
jgi:hypothetical protein